MTRSLGRSDSDSENFDDEAATDRARRNERIITRYVDWLRRDGAPQLTTRKTGQLLWRLAVWMERRHATAVEDVTRTQLVEWRDSLTVCPRTVAGYVSIVRVFYREYLMEHLERREDDPSRGLKRPRRVAVSEPRPVPEPIVHRALDAARDNPLMLGWLLLMRYCGLRRFEVAGLRCADLTTRDDDSGGAWLRVQGKGGRIRHVPVPPEVVGRLQQFRGTGGPLFRKDDSSPYSAGWIGDLVAAHFAALRQPGEDRYTAHQLRHSFATRSLEECQNLRKVQELLGHASPDTTAIYTQVVDASLAEVVDQMTTRSFAGRGQRRRLFVVDGDTAA